MMVIDMNKCVLLQTFIKGSGGDCSSSNQLSSLLYWESYLYTYILISYWECYFAFCAIANQLSLVCKIIDQLLIIGCL